MLVDHVPGPSDGAGFQIVADALDTSINCRPLE